jgi:hypothetical protein
VTFTGTEGTLTLPKRAGLAFIAGDGTADVSTKFLAKISAANAALNGLNHKPSVINGEASIRIIKNDDPLGDDEVVNIDVVSP